MIRPAIPSTTLALKCKPGTTGTTLRDSKIMYDPNTKTQRVPTCRIKPRIRRTI